MDLYQIEPQGPLLVVPLRQKWPKQTQIIFSQHFDHYYLLYIIALCYHTQFQQNPMIFSQENGKKPYFWLILAPFCPNFRPPHFLLKIGLRHFSPLQRPWLHAKKLRQPMAGSMGTLQTYGRTGTDYK